MRDRTSAIMGLFSSMVIGFGCVVIPPLVLDRGATRLAIFPLGNVIEQIRPLYSAIGLFLTGGVTGFFWPRYWHILGLATVALLPAVTIIEIIVNPKSHNLWPIEFVIYAFYAIPGFVGAFVGSQLGYRARKNRKSTAGDSN